MNKMRVWFMIMGLGTPFYVPVETVEDAQRAMDILGSYSQYLVNKEVMSDHCNACGVEVYDEESGEWEDWYYDYDGFFYDDVDSYIEEMSPESISLATFQKEIYSQVRFD